MATKLEAGQTVSPFAEKTGFLPFGERTQGAVLREDLVFPWASGSIYLRQINSTDDLGKFKTPFGAIITEKIYLGGSITESPLPVVPLLELAVHLPRDWQELLIRRPILLLNEELYNVMFDQEQDPDFARVLRIGGGGLRVIGSVEPVLLPFHLPTLKQGIALTTKTY